LGLALLDGELVIPQFASWSVRSELRQLQCPLFALHGELDEFGSLEHLAVARQLAGATVTTTVLRSQGHIPHKEDPQAIVGHVEQFLRYLT
jgi:pimeloyl-ACP methyl ester carboxylesterase